MKQIFKSEKQKMEEEVSYWKNTKWLVASIAIALAVVSVVCLKVHFGWTLISAISSISCLAGFFSMNKIIATLNKRLIWLHKLEADLPTPKNLKELHTRLLSQKSMASQHSIQYAISMHQSKLTEAMLYKAIDEN